LPLGQWLTAINRRNPMAKPSPVIADHPPSEMYQPGLEIECQCARCGSSCDWQRCSDIECEDGYLVEGQMYDEDDSIPVRRCDVCDGYGGWQKCLSSPEWCSANPLPGREDEPRGKIEWFVIKEQPNG
jgi:hypothetical protein